MTNENKKQDYKNTLSWTLFAAVIIAGLIWGVPHIIRKIFDTPVAVAENGYALAQKIAGDIGEALQFRPIITVNQEVVFDRSVPIAQLALAEKKFTHVYTLEDSFMHSKKKISIKGHFRAKGGYDLSEPFMIDVSKDGKSVAASVPEPKVLSVELMREEILEEEGGLWNSISAKDRDFAKNSLLLGARKTVNSSSLKAEVEDELERRLRDLLKGDEVALSITAASKLSQ